MNSQYKRLTSGFVGVAAIFFALLFLLPMKAFCVQIVDDQGETVSLAQPARRVIPLYGAFAEMLYAVGAGSRIVARTEADRFPQEIGGLPSVGTHMRPNVEMILGFKPDLVIQNAGRQEELADMERLRQAGIPIAVFAPKDFRGIFSTMERLGVLTGHEDEARDAVNKMEKRLDDVRAGLADIGKHSRVFFEVRAEPLTAAGKGSIVQGILAAAGAENVVRNEKAIVQYNFEALLVDDPDVYVVQRGPMNRNPLEPGNRTHFGRLRAVREGRVIDVDEYIFSRPGPRCVDAVELLAAALYPERAGRAKAE